VGELAHAERDRLDAKISAILLWPLIAIGVFSLAVVSAFVVAIGSKADMTYAAHMSASDPKRIG
jgi:hypothetical protein